VKRIAGRQDEFCLMGQSRGVRARCDFLIIVSLTQPRVDPMPYLPKLPKMDLDIAPNFFQPVFWGAKDPEVLADLMAMAAKQVSGFYFSDNLFAFGRNMSLARDKPFIEAWDKAKESPSDAAILWRRYILCCAGYHCVQLEGDFVECGAYTGVAMKTVIDYLGGAQFEKNFWGYDLFEFPENATHDRFPEHGPDLFRRVTEKFQNYKTVKIIQGELPAILEHNSPEKIAYLHLDLNQASAEVGCLNALFDRMVPGGILILDDYEQLGYGAQKKAEDEWFETRGYRVFPLPTAQGLVIKR
jgi:hypothetical protein